MAQLEYGNPLYHEVRGGMDLRQLMDKAIELGMSLVEARMSTDGDLVTYIAKHTGRLAEEEPPQQSL